MKISCVIVLGNEEELEGHDLQTWLREFFFYARASISPNEWWLSNRAIREIAPFKEAS